MTKFAVKEKLQDCDASARDGAMSGRIGRMGRRTFRKSLRQKIVAILIEARLHRLRIENVAVQLTVDRVALAGQNLPRDGAARFRPMAKVNPPFLIPDAVQSRARRGAECRGEVRPAEGAETILRARTDVGIARV